MRRLLLLFALLAWPSLAQAQTYFPFGMVNVPTTAVGGRVLRIGCSVSTAAPALTDAEIHPCSLTELGELRVIDLSSATIAGNTTDIETAIELLNPKFPTAATLANNMALPSSTLIGAVCMVYDGATLDLCLQQSGGAGAVDANTSRVVQASHLLKRYISAGVTEDESQVKATAGVLRGVSARNAHATTNAYLKCTNLTAASTTPGSSAIFYEMLIPAGPGAVVDGAINSAFDTALTCYIVTGATDASTVEVAAGDVSYNLRYD